MSDNTTDRRDDGMTLIELMVGVMVMGLITTVLSFALIVILKQQDNAGGRLNNANSEYGAGLWMPADLASAGENVDTSPNATSCFGTCPASVDVGGSNTLLLSWTTEVPNNAQTGVTTQTVKVSYRYVFDGEHYDLIRIECTSKEGAVSCRKNTVLRDLEGPPLGTTFTAGVTIPSWVMTVSVPPDPADTGTGDPIPVDPGLKTKNAQKVTVTINGGGDIAGAGGGVDQISLSAGGTNRELIDATSLQGAPNLIAARSRCGGAITMIVDESSSIGSTALAQVKTAIKGFVEAFAGTPVKLQLVHFATYANALGSGTDWVKYYNMLVDTEVTSLYDAVDSLVSNGNTNWEDALFHTFYNANGSVQSILPGLVVFFTDGVPTHSRVDYTTATSAPTLPPARLPGYPAPTGGGTFHHESWYRANEVAKQFRDTVRFIGVGVGPDISDTNQWITNVPGWHYEYTRKFNYNYLRWYHIESKSGSSWNDAPTQSQPQSTTTQRRVNFSATYRNSVTVLPTDRSFTDLATSWTNPSPNATNQTVYNTKNDSTKPDDFKDDGWSRTKTYSSSGTNSEPATLADYNAGLTGVVRSKVYGAPYTNFDAPQTVGVTSDKVLARLIAGNDTGVPGTKDAGGNYTNAAVANMYILPQWNQFGAALKAVALAECGGTLTLQTKVGTTSAADPFTYQKAKVFNSAGAEIDSDHTVVTTTKAFPSGTFDLAIPSGTFLNVEILPQNFSDLTGYNPGTWSCKAGITPRTFELVDIPNTGWKGIRVHVGANEAVSCIQSVTRL